MIKKGFTLLEILISITVLIILATIIFSVFLNLRNIQTLKSAGEQVMALIDEARFKTLSSRKDTQYGVHFETGKVILFEGAVFSELDSNNKDLVISSLVEFSQISLNGGVSDLVFKRLTGGTDQYGIITLRLKGDVAKTKNITIESTAIVNYE